MADEAPPDSGTCGPAVVVNGIRQDCGMGVWDNALEHADSELASILDEDDPAECFAHGANWGVCWYVAIVGMFEEMRRTYGCHECYCHLGPYERHVASCCCAFFDDHVCTPTDSPRTDPAKSDG